MSGKWISTEKQSRRSSTAKAVAGKKVKPERPVGRSAGLVEARNRHLLCRFIFWHQKKDARYEWVVAQLSREFYLTPSTVGQIIAASCDEIKLLREQKSISHWAKEYNFFRW